MKKTIYIILILFFGLMESQTSLAALCLVNGGGAITNNPDVGFINDCDLQPTTQRITFLKAAVCKAPIALPTTAVAIDTSSCTTIWQSENGDTGSLVDIQLGIEETLNGSDSDVTIPPPGAYSVVYLEMKPEFGIAAQAQFAQAMADTSGNAAGGGRVFCRSRAITIQNFTAANPANATLCSAASGTAGITTTHFNSLGDDGNNPPVGTPTFASGTLSAALITANRKLIPAPTLGVAGTEDKLVAWFTQTVNVTANTTGFTVGFSNAIGTAVELGNLSVRSFHAGEFGFTLTPK
jgi:hypothetical protein